MWLGLPYWGDQPDQGEETDSLASSTEDLDVVVAFFLKT